MMGEIQTAPFRRQSLGVIDLLPAHRQVQNPSGESVHTRELARLVFLQGDRSEALTLYEQAISLGRGAGSRVNEAMAQSGLGLVLAHAGDLVGAVTALTQAEALLREGPSPAWLGALLLHKAEVEWLSGQSDAARRTFAEACALARPEPEETRRLEALFQIGSRLEPEPGRPS